MGNTLDRNDDEQIQIQKQLLNETLKLKLMTENKSTPAHEIYEQTYKIKVLMREIREHRDYNFETREDIHINIRRQNLKNNTKTHF